MTKTEAERLAAAIHAIRPDWPVPSLLTFISRSDLQQRAYRDAAVALAWVATDEKTKTPARVLEPGPWWRATQADNPTLAAVSMKCPDHPTERAWDCQPCIDLAGQPRPGQLRQAIKEARR